MSADRLAEGVTEAVRGYQRIFPVPYKLSPNLRLAVDALAARDRAEAALARVREALDRMVLPHQVTGEPTGRHAQAAADYIRAAIEGTDS